jgi:dihydrolipoamide dehydrogenase
MASSYDMVVIGSGPGGYVAAIRAAQLGMKTAVVEREAVVGGRCLTISCMPAKAMLRAAEVLTEAREGATFGVNATDVSFDIVAAGAHRDKAIKTLTGGVAGLFKKHKIELLTGNGSLVAAGRVSVDGTEVEAKKILLAAGSVSSPIPGASFGGRVLDTAGMWLINEQPKRLAVIGAGASGAEVASAFGRFGTEVVLIEMLDQILPAEEPEIAKLVTREFKSQNITVVTGVGAEKVEASDSDVKITYGGNTESFDYLCIATGRAPDTAALGLDAAGVKTAERGLVEVDGALRTSVDGIYAIGDLVPGPALAHKASDEGIIAVEDAAGLPTHPINYDDIPRATFCYPQVASFGLTEAQATERGHDVVVGSFPMAGAGASTVYGERKGIVKMIGDRKYGELLGAHIVAAKATEMIAELVLAKQLEGGYEEIARTVHPHPTFSEAVMEAARATSGWVIHA